MDDGSDVDQHDFNDVDEVMEQQDVEEDVEAVLPVAHTRNLLEKFRQMEDSSIPPPSPERSTRIQRAAVQQVSARKATVVPPISNGHATNIEADECDDRLSGEYTQDNLSPEGGVFENEPQHNPDVVRGDEPAIEPLPEQGTTRNLLAKFQALQSTYWGWARSKCRCLASFVAWHPSLAQSAVTAVTATQQGDAMFSAVCIRDM